MFSLIKRGAIGTFHSISRKHLANNLNEFEYRWNTRKQTMQPAALGRFAPSKASV